MKRILSLTLLVILIFSMLFVNGSFMIDVFAEDIYYGLFSDESSDGGFEYSGWKSFSVPSNANWQTVNTQSFRGNNSAEFNFGTTGGYKEIYICMDVPAETVEKIKTYKNYCWTSYIKTSTNFMGSVSFKLIPFGQYSSEGLKDTFGHDEVQLYTHSVGKPSDWVRFDSEEYYYQSDNISEFFKINNKFSVVLKVRGARGTIWVDDVDLKQTDTLSFDDTVDLEDTYGDFAGNLKNYSFENIGWTVAKKTDQIVTLDTTNGHGNSKTALKVQMFERKAHYGSAINFTTSTIAGVAEELDTTKNYRAAIWVKSTEDFQGSISYQVSQNGQKKWYNYQTELHLIGNNTTAATGYSNWTYLYTPNFTVTNDDITVTLIVNGVGTIWFDDAQIILDPEADNVINNGGFEGGVWSTWGTDNLPSETVSTETKVTYGSAKSAKISITEVLDAGVYIVNSFNMAKFDPDKTYVLSFALKYDDVAEKDAVVCSILQSYKRENADGTTTSGNAWYRYNGAEQLLKTGGGSSDWTEYSLTLPSAVWAEGFTGANIYFYLYDKGTLWIDNVKLIDAEKELELEEDVVTADFPSGEIACGTTINLYTKNQEDDIWYTVDGTDPTVSETAYYYKKGTGIFITENLKVKACVKNNDGTMGAVTEYNYLCNGSIIPDDELWAVSNNPQFVTLDTENKIIGENSIKLNRTNQNVYISTGEVPIASYYDYKLSFWVKTENLVAEDRIKLDVFLTSPVGGGAEPHPLIDGLVGATVGDYGESFFDFKVTQDWTYYEVDLHSLFGVCSAINVILRNQRSHGDIWIDGLSLVSVPTKEFPLEIEYSNEVKGNIYTQSIEENFDVQQSFYFKNNAKTCETGIVSYNIVNDIKPETVIGSGNIEVCLNAGESVLQYIDISMAKEYGTYTIEFTMQNSHGALYDIGTLNFSRLIDNTEIMENGGTFLGVCGTTSDGAIANIHNAVGNSMMRMDYDWLDVEKEKGVYTIHESKDNNINIMLKNNIEPMIIFNDHGWPTWMEKRAWPTTEHDVEHFLGYIRFIAETYKGRVKYYEFYNEVDHRHWVSPDIYPDAAGYTELMKKVYTTLKEVNPDAVLIGGVTSGINPGWAQAMLENGAAEYMDAYSVHPYIQDSSPESANWLTNMQNLCNIFKEYTGRDFPLFITELGWPNSRTTVKGNTYHDTLAYSIRTYTFASSLKNMEKVVTYCIGSGDSIYYSENQYGIFKNSTYTASPTVVGRAAYNYMHYGFEFDSAPKFAQGFYSYKYSGKTEDMYVLWTDDRDTTATITTSSNKAKMYDIYGNPIEINYNGNTFSTKIGRYVMYLRLEKGETINSVTVTKLQQNVLANSMLTNGGLETKPAFWNDDSPATIDKSCVYEGYSSLKLNLFQNGFNATTFVLNVSDKAIKNLDSSINYKLKFYAKSDGNFKGNLIIDPKMYSNGKEFFTCNWLYGSDYPIVRGGTIPTEWTEYETQPFPLMGDSAYIMINVNNKDSMTDAIVWLDRFELVPVEENKTNGIIKVEYEVETGLTLVTVTGKEGYMPTGVIARRAKSANVSNYEQIETLGGYRTAANQLVYAVDFGEYNKYYQGQSFKLFDASYTKIPDADIFNYRMGDVNFDFTVNLLDMIHLKKHLLGLVKSHEIDFFYAWYDRSKYTLGATDLASLKKQLWNSL